MIDADTTWQQACTALAGGDFETAFGVLDSALEEAMPAKARPRQPAQPTAARLCLYLGSLHALYGDAATEQLKTALDEARTLDPALGTDPLYLALSAELDARTRGPDAAPPAGAAREAADAVARFHTLCALALAEQPQAALDLHLAVTELPEHLRWRLRSWQADCQEQLGHTADAIHLYAEAAHLATGLDRAVMLQEQAALLIQDGQAEAAKTVLDGARLLYRSGQTPQGGAGLRNAAPSNPGQVEDEAMNLATWHYLRAQALLQMGQPETAYEMIREADRLERLHGTPGYVVALLRGQILSHLGQQEPAIAAFEAALALAEDGDRPYANHELGVALLDMDRPVEARDRLEAVLTEPDYPYLPEVLADVAECDYRLGRMPEAQLAAEQALAQGAVIPASLVLGSVALDYFQLDDALEHYERVVREAAPGSRDWITGHQMAADVMAQQGFPAPAAAVAHAQQALAHTPESDDWHGTLQDLLTRAQEVMGQQDGRMLN